MPKRARKGVALAQEMVARGDYEGCARRLEKTVARFGDAPFANFLLAQCYQHLERWDDAYEHFVRKRRTISFARYEDAVRRFAEKNDALVDLTPQFTAMTRGTSYADDMHANSLGHEIIADGLFDAIRGELTIPIEGRERAATRSDRSSRDTAAARVAPPPAT